MAADNPNPGVFCPSHIEVQGKIRDIEQKQGRRPCDTHTAEIKSLGGDIAKVEADNKTQWKAINQLRFLVWGGTGIMALIGSAFGNLIISYFRGGGKP